MQSYTVRVATTNYNQFAIVYFRKVYKNQEYFKTTLYGGSPPLPRGPGSWSHCQGRGPRQPSPPRSSPVSACSPCGQPGREVLLQTLHEEGIRGLVHAFNDIYGVFAGHSLAIWPQGGPRS